MSEEALSNEIITYESSMHPLIVTNDLMLKMIRETGAKHFITSQKLDCLAQHPKKILNQNDTSRWEKIKSKAISHKFKIRCLPLQATVTN